MQINTATITNPTTNSFKLRMEASVTNAGPLPATVSFEGPLEVSWEDLLLVTMDMSSFKLSGGAANISEETQVIVVDVPAFSKFNTYM